MEETEVVGAAWRLVFSMIGAGVSGDDPCRDEELAVFTGLKDVAVFDEHRTMTDQAPRAGGLNDETKGLSEPCGAQDDHARSESRS